MWEMEVTSRYPSGMLSPRASLMATTVAYLPATSLPRAPLCAGTHRMVTSLSREDSCADLGGCDSEALAGAEGIAPHPIYSGGGVDENRVPMAALLVLVEKWRAC